MKNIFTKELDGTLLIVMPDERSFEMSRSNISSQIVITPDNDAKYTPEEEKIFRELWANSNCKLR